MYYESLRSGSVMVPAFRDVPPGIAVFPKELPTRASATATSRWLVDEATWMLLGRQRLARIVGRQVRSPALTKAQLAAAYRKFLARPGLTEGKVQRYLEEHSELIPTPWLQNHRLHFQSVIAKLPLDTSLVCDFAYLTKSSVDWDLVFVEIEHPSKRYFTGEQRQVEFSADFNGALSQIESWRTFVDRNAGDVLRHVSALREPLSQNPVDFKYVLVYGRRDEIGTNQARIDRLARFRRSGLIVMSHDSLISGLQEGGAHPRNVLAPWRHGFKVKYLNEPNCNLWTYVRHHDLQLGHGHVGQLKKAGVHIDEWLKGELLSMNGKPRWRSGGNMHAIELIERRVRAQHRKRQRSKT